VSYAAESHEQHFGVRWQLLYLPSLSQQGALARNTIGECDELRGRVSISCMGATYFLRLYAPSFFFVAAAATFSCANTPTTMQCPLAPLPVDDVDTRVPDDRRNLPMGTAIIMATPPAIDAHVATTPLQAPPGRPRWQVPRVHRARSWLSRRGRSRAAAALPAPALQPSAGPGGVQLTTHAWGLEAVLVFQSPDAAARAVDVLEKLESLDLNIHGAVHSVALTSRIRAKLTDNSRRGSKDGLHFKTNVTTVTVQATAPPPMLVLMPAPYATPFAPQHYPCYNAPMYIPAPQLPLPPTYVLVPDPLYARGGGKSSP